MYLPFNIISSPLISHITLIDIFACTVCRYMEGRICLIPVWVNLILHTSSPLTPYLSSFSAVRGRFQGWPEDELIIAH